MKFCGFTVYACPTCDEPCTTYHTQLLFQSSHMQVTNFGGIEWLRRHLGDDYKIHVISPFLQTHAKHIDTTMAIPKPGIVLLNYNIQQEFEQRKMFEDAQWKVNLPNLTSPPPPLDPLSLVVNRKSLYFHMAGYALKIKMCLTNRCKYTNFFIDNSVPYDVNQCLV